MKNETNLSDVERFNGADVLKVMEMIKKPSTNFDRITASPEALAEFIEDVTYRCYGCKVIFADNCPHTRRGKVMFCEKDDCLEWLNEEYKE